MLLTSVLNGQQPQHIQTSMLHSTVQNETRSGNVNGNKQHQDKADVAAE